MSDKLGLIWNHEDFSPRKPLSFKISNVYFLRHNMISCFDCATSIPNFFLVDLRPLI